MHNNERLRVCGAFFHSIINRSSSVRVILRGVEGPLRAPRTDDMTDSSIYSALSINRVCLDNTARVLNQRTHLTYYHSNDASAPQPIP